MRNRSRRLAVSAVVLVLLTVPGLALEQNGPNFIVDWLQDATRTDADLAVDSSAPGGPVEPVDGTMPEVQIKFLVNQCDSDLDGPQDLFEDPDRVATAMGVDPLHPPVIAPPINRRPALEEAPVSVPSGAPEPPISVAALEPEPEIEVVPVPRSRPDIPAAPVVPEPVADPIQPVAPPVAPLVPAADVAEPAETEVAAVKIKVPAPLDTRIEVSGSFVMIEVGPAQNTANAAVSGGGTEITQTSPSIIYLD